MADTGHGIRGWLARVRKQGQEAERKCQLDWVTQSSCMIGSLDEFAKSFHVSSEHRSVPQDGVSAASLTATCRYVDLIRATLYVLSRPPSSIPCRDGTQNSTRLSRCGLPRGSESPYLVGGAEVVEWSSGLSR